MNALAELQVCVLGAGGPAGYNVAAAAAAAGWRVIGVDSNPDHLVWAGKVCQEVLLLDGFPPELFEGELLVLPQPETLVLAAALAPGIRYHGPSWAAIEITQDKAFPQAYGESVLFGPETADYLNLAKDTFGLPFWLRARQGAGARGALKVDDLRAAHHWIRLHEVLGSRIEWVANEYLPGRDFCWSGLFHEGELMAGFARERLEWIYPHLSLTGRTGTPTICMIVHDERVSQAAQEAVYSLVEPPNGIYCVDLRENGTGDPVVTEINAGRYATTTPLYRVFGANVVDMQIRLGHGFDVEPLGDNIYPEHRRLCRHIDMGMVTT
jgi:hypothetical protein